MYIYPLLRYAFSHALFEHPSFLCTSHIALFARNLAARVRVREEHTPVEVSCEASTVARAAIQETMAGFSHQLLAFLRSSSPALPPGAGYGPPHPWASYVRRLDPTSLVGTVLNCAPMGRSPSLSSFCSVIR